MELKLTRQPLFINEPLIDQTVEQPIECDALLPDYCPDIVRILKCSVAPVLTGRRASPGKLELEGTCENLTAETMSGDISLCQGELGTALFQRIDNRMVLTYAGECYLEHIKQIFAIQAHMRALKLSPGEIVPVDIEIWPHSRFWHTGEALRIEVGGSFIRTEWYEDAKMGFATDNNNAIHVIHTGGKYDSFLQIPVIPPKYQVNDYIVR